MEHAGLCQASSTPAHFSLPAPSLPEALPEAWRAVEQRCGPSEGHIFSVSSAWLVITAVRWRCRRHIQKLQSYPSPFRAVDTAAAAVATAALTMLCAVHA